MKRCHLSLCLFIIVLNSCLFVEDYKLDCQTSELLIERDQRFRTKHMDILTPELFLMDSLLIVNGFSQGLDELGNASIELRKMVREQTERIMETRINPPKRVLDSVRLLQYNLDVENTKILLNIISRLERKDNALRAYKCARESFIVFVHTPDKYKDQVRKEIERIDLRSIDEDQYDHIMWHLNGRN